MAIKRKWLVSAAKDMNEVMGLDPEIDLDLEDEELQKEILKNADAGEDGVKAEDNLEDATWNTLAELGFVIDKDKVEPEAATPDQAEKAPKAGKEKAEKVKKEKAPKVKEEKAPKVKEEKAPKVKKEKTPKYLREYSVVDAVVKAGKKGKSFEEIAELANSMYVKQGGSDNVKQSLHVVKIGIKFLARSGVAILKDDDSTIASA